VLSTIQHEERGGIIRIDSIRNQQSLPCVALHRNQLERRVARMARDESRPCRAKMAIAVKYDDP
jgi:hypothetical protein